MKQSDLQQNEAAISVCLSHAGTDPRLEAFDHAAGAGFAGREIYISEKSVLRRSTNKNASGIPTRFESNENLLGLKLEHGTPAAVSLAGGGQMLLAATSTDTTGRPIVR